jgi:hypothetical protein
MRVPVDGFVGQPVPRRRKRRSLKSAAAGAPVLVAASFVAAPDPQLTLTFDRDIDISDLHADGIEVFDGPGGTRYGGDSAGGGTGGATLVLNMTPLVAVSGPQVLLTAGGDTGIVAASGGGAEWAGASDLPLPVG